MAVNKGMNGVILIDAETSSDLATANAIINVTSFSLEETTETIDITSMDSTQNAREVLPTFVSFTGSVEGYWDTAETSMSHTESDDPVVKAGAAITFELYPDIDAHDTSTAGNYSYYRGNAIVTSVSRTQSFDGATQFTLNFDGNGPLDYKVKTVS